MNSHASFWEAVKGALHSLRGSKLRSFLTLLGIILATTTLIAVMSVISGMDVYIAKNVSSMGADGYTVQRIVMMGYDPKKYLEMLRRNPQLTKEEYEFLHQRLTMTKEIGISAGRSVTVHRGTEVSENVGLQGASPNIGVINNIEADEGRFLSEIENDRHRSEEHTSELQSLRHLVCRLPLEKKKKKSNKHHTYSIDKTLDNNSVGNHSPPTPLTAAMAHPVIA